MTTKKDKEPNIHQLRRDGQWTPDVHAHWRRLGHPELADEHTQQVFAAQLGLSAAQLSLGSSFHRDYWRDAVLSAYNSRQHNSKLHLHIQAIHRWMQTWSPLCFAGPNRFPETLYSLKSKKRYDEQMMADGWSVTIRLNHAWRLRVATFPEISPWSYLRDLAMVGGWCSPEEAQIITNQARLLCESGKINDSQIKLGKLFSGKNKNPEEKYSNLISLVRTINRLSELVRDHRKNLAFLNHTESNKIGAALTPHPASEIAQSASISPCCPPLLSTLSNRRESNRSETHVVPTPSSEQESTDDSIRLMAQRARGNNTARARTTRTRALETAKKPKKQNFSHPREDTKTNSTPGVHDLPGGLEDLSEELYWFSNNQTGRCVLLAPKSDVAADRWNLAYLVQRHRPVSRAESRKVIENLSKLFGCAPDQIASYLYQRFRKYYRYACHNQPMTVSSLFRWLVCDAKEFVNTSEIIEVEVPMAHKGLLPQLDGPVEELRRGLSAVRSFGGSPEYARDVDKFYNAFRVLHESGRWVDEMLSWLTTSPPKGVCEAATIDDAVDCVVEFLMDPRPDAPCLKVLNHYRKSQPNSNNVQIISRSWEELSPDAAWLFRWVSLTRRANWQQCPECFSPELFESAALLLKDRIGDSAFANLISLEWIGLLYKAPSLDDALRKVLWMSNVAHLEGD